MRNNVERLLTAMVLVTMLLLPALFTRAQKTVQLPADSVKFITELNTLFSGIGDDERKLIRTDLEDFTLKWNSNVFDARQKQDIYLIANGMLSKKYRHYPDFWNYIRTLKLFLDSRQERSSFDPWSEILKKLLADKNSRKFLAFLETTTHLYEGNFVYQSPSTRWKTVTTGFRFHYDSVPSFSFSSADLICYANDDSLNIYQTKGTYYPLTNLWKGQGGKVTWKRAGEDPAVVYADLTLYEIQMRFSKYTAESVTFIHRKYFPSPVIGRLTDKVLADVTEEKASYPRFYSYDKVIGIPKLFPNIDYLGGFAMEGSRIIGSGDKTRDARLFFKKDGRDFIIARSQNFIIRPDRINSSIASITIYHDNDSIFHPGLQMKYDDSKRELAFTKDERIATISPWFDSFHKIEIFCEALYYKVGEPKISFEMLKGTGKDSRAIFESSSFYSQGRYEKVQGIDEINPLNLIKQYTERKKTRRITLDELTQYMNKPVEQVEWILLNLTNKGFLVYDFEDKVATVKDKLYNYVNARNARADYDVIAFNSEVTNTSNAVLNLETFDLKILGVPIVMLSDSQEVKVYPKTSEVILRKDMDFMFTGKLEAGLFDLYVKDASFEYNKFRINLPAVDSMTFFVKSAAWDPKSMSFPLIRVKTAIRRLAGMLQIDDSANKSGLKALKGYPIFTNRDTSYVYWDRKDIQNGVYRRDRFFFEVRPFTINSMDVVATDSLRFTGVLTSAGIFPRIDEPLKVRPDYSLGLEKMTDTAGLQTYGGKGRFVSKIDLSDRGLHGTGTLFYLNSKTISDDFLFLPESSSCFARRFKNNESAVPSSFPMVKADSVNQVWLPYRDSMSVTTIRKDMAMYNNQMAFKGTLSLTPSAMSGRGTAKISDAEMESKGFLFSNRFFDAMIASFRIKSYGLSDTSIRTKNYQAHFDFDQRKGQFRSNAGISRVEFPLNRYICTMDRFDWLIDSREILFYNDRSKSEISDSLSLTSLIDRAYTGSEFVSVHPKQDSLKFFAASATYNIASNQIRARDVRIIKVADAAIFPDSGLVTIEKGARMETLKRASVIADIASRQHRFFNARISINSRKSYTGNGDYDYRDHAGNVTPVHFDQIMVDTTGQTIAEGAISDSAKFLLGPEFAYKGKVAVKAKQKLLYFDGFFSAVTSCLASKPDWTRFSSIIDPAHIRIPLSEPLKNSQNETTGLGLVFSNAENRIKPLFFRHRYSFSDSTLVSSTGFIEYNKPAEEFRIGSEERLDNPAAGGSYLSLNTTRCRIGGEGRLNLGMKSGNLKLETFGSVDYFVIPDSARLHLAIAISFPFSEAALQKMTGKLESVNLNGLNIMKTPYSEAIDLLNDPQEAGRLKSELDLIGRYRRFPETMDRTLFLADVWMKWDTNSRSYVSYGPIGIGSIGKTQVNRYVNGIIEFAKKKRDDDFTIYLELTPDDWFFLNFRSNLMQAISSDLSFNDIIIQGVQSRAEMSRVAKEAKGYHYSISTNRKRTEFLRKFREEESD